MLCVGGIIGKVKLTTTKKTGEKMAILSLEDLEGSVEVLVFPSTFSKTYPVIKENGIVFIKGRLSLKEEAPKVIAEDIIPAEEVKQKLTSSITLHLHTSALEESRVQQLKEVLSRHRGEIPLYLNFKSVNQQDLRILVNQSFFILPTPAFETDVEHLVGEGVIEFSSQITVKKERPLLQKNLDKVKEAMV